MPIIHNRTFNLTTYSIRIVIRILSHCINALLLAVPEESKELDDQVEIQGEEDIYEDSDDEVILNSTIHIHLCT